MAHFAELDKNNIVLRVVVVDDEYEQEGIEWCEKFFNGGIWVQTSYMGSIRKNYAGVGYTYDPNRDAFIAPKPLDSFVLNEETCRWVPSIPFPMSYIYVKDLDGSEHDKYRWDEETLSWIGPLVFNREDNKWEVK
tara:strand:- start:91 stop:495 length:405 start_codon:yes stop_codon:yes gene_type:complete